MLMVWVGNNEMKAEAAMERPTGAGYRVPGYQIGVFRLDCGILPGSDYCTPV